VRLVRALAQSRGNEASDLLDHIATDVVRPNYPEWRALDIIVKSWLYDLISVELRVVVSSPIATTRVIWLAVEAVFRNNDLTRAMVLTDEFHQTKQLEQPLGIYITRLKAISDELRDPGYPLETVVRE
jgi:hypothetical protein